MVLMSMVKRMVNVFVDAVHPCIVVVILVGCLCVVLLYGPAIMGTRVFPGVTPESIAFPFDTMVPSMVLFYTIPAFIAAPVFITISRKCIKPPFCLLLCLLQVHRLCREYKHPCEIKGRQAVGLLLEALLQRSQVVEGRGAVGKVDGVDEARNLMGGLMGALVSKGIMGWRGGVVGSKQAV